MGLRKNIKKRIKTLNFYLSYFNINRDKNSDIDNFSETIILNPQKIIEFEIPKIIWIYWENSIPEFIALCIKNIKTQNPNYTVMLLNHDNYKTYSRLDFDDYPNTTPQLKSDLLRLDLLYIYGGIWLDASTLIYNNLDWIENFCKKNKTNSFGYYRALNTTITDYPVIESWILATYKNNIFFQAWLDELKLAITITPKKYIDKIKNENENYQEFFQNIGDLEYLIIYLACQTVQRKQKLCISLINCDKNALFLQNKYNFGTIELCKSLIINKKPDTPPLLIKLIGSDRNMILKVLNKPFIRIKKNSLLDL